MTGHGAQSRLHVKLANVTAAVAENSHVKGWLWSQWGYKLDSGPMLNGANCEANF